jgi:protein-arginine kinase activator protein McsA
VTAAARTATRERRECAQCAMSYVALYGGRAFCSAACYAESRRDARIARRQAVERKHCAWNPEHAFVARTPTQRCCSISCAVRLHHAEKAAP